jgi:hypothetical protein
LVQLGCEKRKNKVALLAIVAMVAMTAVGLVAALATADIAAVMGELLEP